MKFPSSLCFRPQDTLWFFMFVVLLTAPFFPGRLAFGFYSVEWSFFFFAGILITIFALVACSRGLVGVVYDPIVWWIGIYVCLMLVSAVDARGIVKSIIYAGSFIPYYVIIYIAIVYINDIYKLQHTINMLTKLMILFILLILFIYVMLLLNLMPSFIYKTTALGGVFDKGMRWYLDNSMLNLFNIGILKAVSYIELPLSIFMLNMLNKKINFYRTFIFVLIAIAIVLTGSRGNYAMFIGILGLSILKSKNFVRKISILSLFVGIFCLAFLTTDYVRERLNYMVVTSEADYESKIEAFSRVYTAKVALEVMLEHPWNGIGAWNLAYYMEDAIHSTKGIPLEILHYWEKTKLYQTQTTPLKLGAEMGIGGFIFFFAFYFYLWDRVRKAKRAAPKDMQIILDGCGIAVIAGFVHNFVDVSFYNYYSWLNFGIICATTRIAQRKTDSGV